MNRGNDSQGTRSARVGVRVAALALLGGVLLGFGCPGTQTGPGTQTPLVMPPEPVKAGAGSIGVVILIDTSGSMAQSPKNAADKQRPKSALANEALQEIVRQTSAWAKKHAEKQPINVAITSFSETVKPVLGMGKFDEATTEKAIKSIPSPTSNTAIGLALLDGWSALKAAGCERQYILCITDGENNKGVAPPEALAQITRENKEKNGKLEIHFIAFDVQANLFGYVKDYDGHLVEAGNLEQLKAELARIFKERVLLESPD